MAEADRLWDLWAGAFIDCEIDGVARRIRGPGASGLPADGPVFTVTAYNPNGVERDVALNEADERRLEAELRAAGHEFWRATGHSADASWSEPGVAIAGISRTEACALGARCGQLGVYELTDDEVHVVRCTDARVMRTRAR